ncbi:putative transcriptional regulator [Terriglobus roseus DSM 18391]|uniref:Putative transcriptional regulator n=1 Tax=Terriglobus roseus (strain DSM 18391 / NRRL B-41598 / KBS 63) TaxID=926566 RepID=I3ZB32_TERRK|nr:PadR family transcriptional regulator [Terriglobus roseus]AFL86450.1 putative transcriptional regulator [Terriglobus roseus DSM 18391]
MSERLPLNDSDLVTLLAILRLGDEAYGVSLCKEIGSITGTGAALASVYKALDRLEQSGLVVSRMGEPSPERGGRAKRLVRVTAKGLRAIDETRAALNDLWRDVPVYGSIAQKEKSR